MKVKVGDQIYDPNQVPIMLIFSDFPDRMEVIDHLTNMHPDGKKYCMYPDGMSEEQVKEFMKIKK